MTESDNIFVEPIGRGRHLRRALGVMQIIEGIRDSLLVQPATEVDYDETLMSYDEGALPYRMHIRADSDPVTGEVFSMMNPRRSAAYLIDPERDVTG